MTSAPEWTWQALRWLWGDAPWRFGESTEPEVPTEPTEPTEPVEPPEVPQEPSPWSPWVEASTDPSAPETAVRTVYADAYRAFGFPNPDAALGDTPGTWAGGAGGRNVNWESVWVMGAFDAPLVGPRSTVSFLVRRTDHRVHPTARFSLWVAGREAVVFDPVEVTSTAGVEVVCEVDHFLLAGGPVEFGVASLVGRGPARERAHVQLARVAWTAEVDAG